MTKIKICGLTTPETMTAALEAGADFVGLVFHPASPRHLEIEVAAYLASYVPSHVRTVGLFVDPTDRILDETLGTVRLDMIQLHGAESPARVSEIRARFGLPVMKCLSIETADDLAAIPLYDSADWILLDAKGTAAMPGGTGTRFDWTLLDGFKMEKPWMLAGGLTPENVADAIRELRPDAVDVSSGVEQARGIKDPAKIHAFIEAARSGAA